jgi:hypothetical protein
MIAKPGSVNEIEQFFQLAQILTVEVIRASD